MEASGSNKAGCQPSDARKRRVALGRILRMGVSDGGKSSSSEMLAMGELETELALLREENARLKVERHRPADAGRVIERMRSIRQDAPGAPREDGTPSSADGGQALAELLALREGMMYACREARQAMQGIRGRLETLTGEIHSRTGERAMSERLAAPTAEAMDGVPGSAEEGSSELAQSVA
jgi:hypothetical protein